MVKATTWALSLRICRSSSNLQLQQCGQSVSGLSHIVYKRSIARHPSHESDCKFILGVDNGGAREVKSVRSRPGP